MTQSSHPILDQQRAEILSMWKVGHDTFHIALRVGLREHQVYGVIAHRRDIPKPAPLPKVKAKPKTVSSRRPIVVPRAESRCAYRLRDGSLYLHQSGEGKTPYRNFAWQGSAEQAIACCEKYPAAKDMSMELVL